MQINATITTTGGSSVAYLVSDEKRLDRIPSGTTVKLETEGGCAIYARIKDAALALELDLRA